MVKFSEKPRRNHQKERPPLQKIISPENLRIEPLFARQKSPRKSFCSLCGAPCRSPKFLTFSNKFYSGCGTWIRTKINGFRVRCPTIRRSRNLSRKAFKRRG